MPRPRSDIEPRIVHAARNRFLADGVDGASLRKIARDARTSIGMIYYYFPSKDDLFLAVVEEVYEGLLHKLEEALTPNAPIAERIRRLSARIGRLDATERDVIRLMVREALVSSSRLDRLLARFQRGHVARMFALVEEGRAAGELDREHHPVLLMIAVFAVSGAPQLLLPRLAGALPAAGIPSGEALADELVDILFHGIAAPGGGGGGGGGGE